MVTKELDTMEQTLIEVINKSVSAVEKGADWMAGQLPQVAEQFLMYHLFEAIALCIFSSGYLIAYAFYLKYAFSKAECPGYSRFDTSEGVTFLVLFGGVAVIFDIGVFIINLLRVIKICIAPKVYLLEWAASVVK